MPLNIILITLGSHGDVHPFVGIGQAMRQRGHRVTLITNPHFQPLIESAGLDFSPIGTVEQFETLRANPDLWHRRKAIGAIFDVLTAHLRPMYEAVLSHVTPGNTVVGASSLAFGARLAQDKFGVPTATLHLAPGLFRSTIEPPNLPGLWMPRWLPQRVKQSMFDVGDQWVIDPRIGPRLNAFRAEIGLPPVKRILAEWWNSPTRVIGLFPEWYGRPQPDWPAQTRCAGFVMYDQRDQLGISPELDAFLNAGPPPMVFTPGSAMFHGERFFAEAAQSCARGGYRGILLSRHAGHIPRVLPPGVAHFDYAPFSELLPRASGIIHHGGIGTTAQALAAGIPQLVCPFAHDQLDNAARVQRLGVGLTLQPRRFRARHIASRLNYLSTTSCVHSACQSIQSTFSDPATSVQATCDLLESLCS